MAFREDGKILVGHASPMDLKAIMGMILLAFLDGPFVYNHHYFRHHHSPGEHLNANKIGCSILLLPNYRIKN